MRIFTDDCMKTGSSHFRCQDYVVSGTEPFAHVILCDGCSSSEKTDVGAAVLALTAAKYLMDRKKKYPDDPIDADLMGRAVIRDAQNTARCLSLPRTGLDATLIAAWREKETVHVNVYGDGGILLVDENRIPCFREITFSENAPFYLSYLLDEERHREYEKHGFVKKENGREIPALSPVKWVFDLNKYPVIMPVSDGITSFIDQAGDKVPVARIAGDFTGFKSLAGAFLKRRMKRAVRDLEKSGITHYDDLSAGAFLSI